MVTGEAFDHAVSLARSNPGLAVGLHLVAVRGKAVLPWEKIPHLVDRQGHFPSSPTYAGLRYFLSSKARHELALELAAQLEKFLRADLFPSHIDSHMWMHVNPAVLSLVLKIVVSYGVKGIRLPGEPLWLNLKLDRSRMIAKAITGVTFKLLGLYCRRKALRKGLFAPDCVFGLLMSGRINQDYLVGLLTKLDGNITEIYCHPTLPREPGSEGDPGVQKGFEELAALLSSRVMETVGREGIELTSYRDECKG